MPRRTVPRNPQKGILGNWVLDLNTFGENVKPARKERGYQEPAKDMQD